MNSRRLRNVPGSGRILIVEDQGIVARDIEGCLEDHGYEVTGIATCPQDAIREASVRRPDLVLMDIRIKGQADGIDVAEDLRRRFDLPVIYLTAHEDRSTLERAKRTQPMGFLIKPFKPAELTSAVEIALQRSRVDQQARERERSFLSAMDAIGDAVLTTDFQGFVRFMNRAAEELTGLRQETALGMKVGDVVRLVNASDAAETGFRAFLNGECPLSGVPVNEFQIIGRDGVWHWITIKVTSIPGVDEHCIRVIVMHDVTRHKQNEESLRRQADLLDQSQDAIFTWELNGAIGYWNCGAQSLYGFSSSESVGQPVQALLPGSTPAKHQTIDAALEREGSWSGELHRQTKDCREIVVESRLIAVRDGTGRRTVLETDRDITERKRTEIEIRRLNQELGARVAELTSLNQELESFNYTISHDLRAPLRHIDAYTKIVLEDRGLGLTDEARKYMDHIQRGSQRMGRMVDELLELSHTSRRAPIRQLTQLQPMVEEVLFEMKPELQNREIEWRMRELSDADCDPVLTRQVFANLLGNAVKFSKYRRPAVIEVGQRTDGAEVVYFVQDNGVGFNMKYAPKLFGVFQRLHRREEFEGTGIGLVTVQRIVQKHGGKVWAEAEPDQGATFYFTLAPPPKSAANENKSTERA